MVLQTPITTHRERFGACLNSRKRDATNPAHRWSTSLIETPSFLQASRASSCITRPDRFDESVFATDLVKNRHPGCYWRMRKPSAPGLNCRP